MSRKTLTVCDACRAEIPDADGAVLQLTYHDARHKSKRADLCDSCADGMPGAHVPRRGRKPKLVEA